MHLLICQNRQKYLEKCKKKLPLHPSSSLNVLILSKQCYKFAHGRVRFWSLDPCHAFTCFKQHCKPICTITITDQIETLIGHQKLSDLSYFAHFQALIAPHGPLRVPKGSQWPTQCAMRSHKIFYYGMISLWENWVLLAWELDQEISEDLRHTLAIFRLCSAPKAPQGTTLCAMRS